MTGKKRYNGWRNRATYDAYLKLKNGELGSDYNHLQHLTKQYREQFELAIEIRNYLGYEEGVDYQELAKVALKK